MKTTPVIFPAHVRRSPTGAEPCSRPRVGRPRRGTEAERIDSLIAVATQVFVRDGYGGSSIDKVASEAGVSTRTIYERFKNKADLLGAVITRLVERDMATI
jgi:AcrR family transcriptional regulator